MRYFLALLFAIATARGAPPANDGIFPCSGKAGSTVEVELSGKANPWPPSFWCSNPNISFSPAEKAQRVTLTIPSDVSPGPVLIRTWNAEGCSEPFLFLVAAATERNFVEDEKQKNRSLDEAAVITEPLPCVIYGRLNPSKDVDCYQIALKKGETFYAYMEGYTFRNGIDSMIHLYHPNGSRVLVAHDNAVNQDPQLMYQVPESGNYTLAVMAIATPPTANVHFHGGAKCSYRINLASHLKDLPARLVPAKGKPDAAISKALTPPIDIFRTLSKPGAADSVTFTAKAKESYQIDVEAFPHRFPTDPVLSLYRPDDKLIKVIDDGKRDYPDSNYLYKSTVDGEHRLVIKDRYGRGGSDFRYRLRISGPTPGISATVDKSNYTIEAGKEISVKVKITRSNGHKAPLKLEVDELPAGVTIAETPEVPEKSGEVTLKLKATNEAPSKQGAFRIALKGTEGDKPEAIPAVFPFQDKTTFAPFLIDEVRDLWLTIKAKKP